MIAVPFGVADSGTALLEPWVLVAGLGVALLSSVIPYTVDLEALRKIPPHVFGILMSLEPAMAALIGFILLGEALHWAQWLAVLCVVAASAGATRRSQPTTTRGGRVTAPTAASLTRQCASIRASSARVSRAASVSSRYRSSSPPRTQALSPSDVTTLWPPWPARR